MMIETTAPVNTVSVDHIVSLPDTINVYKHVLTAIDLTTRYAWAIPLRTQSVEETTDAFISDVVSQFGVQHIVGRPSDNGASFASTYI